MKFDRLHTKVAKFRSEFVRYPYELSDSHPAAAARFTDLKIIGATGKLRLGFSL